MWLCECFRYIFWLLIIIGMTIVNGKTHTMYLDTIYVDQSGRRNFTSIQSAIDAVPSNNSNWICIYVAAGVYKEQVQIPREKQYISLQGEGKWKTSIVWDGNGSLLSSPTFTVNADNFIARSITFVNSYNYPYTSKNPRKPAVAAWIYGDKNSFYNCGFIGLQDTLWDCQGRHYFYRSSIVGAVDFIFGSGQSIYEECTISVSGEALEGPGYITAQGRSNPNDPSGFVFKDCNVIGNGSAYLGRPWRDYARVLYYNSTLSSVIVPQGWNSWGQGYKFTFAEYMCHGPGSDTKQRVKWESKLSRQQLEQLTSLSFIDNEGWLQRQPLHKQGLS